jgi:hypothetical protein
MRRIFTFAVLFALVQNLAAQSEPASWKLVQDLKIGSLDGPLALSAVSDLTVSRDGRNLYVAQRADRSIWMFEAGTGRFIRKIGRGGEGPGEFRRLYLLGWTADTLYATDTDLARVNLFDGSGAYMRTIGHTPVLLPQTRGVTYPIAVVAGGHLVVQSRLSTKALANGDVVSAPLLLADPDGIVDTIAARDLRGTVGAAAVGTATVFVHQPMSQRNYIGVDDFGRSVVVVTQPAGMDTPGTFRVERREIDGTTIYARSFNYTARPVSRLLSDSLIASRATAYERLVAPGRAMEAARRYVTVPRYHPPITDLIVGRDGTTWLRLEDIGAATVNYLVLDLKGDIQAHVKAPAALKVLLIDADKLWGTVQDDLDVPYVVSYRVVQ